MLSTVCSQSRVTISISILCNSIKTSVWVALGFLANKKSNYQKISTLRIFMLCTLMDSDDGNEHTIHQLVWNVQWILLYLSIMKFISFILTWKVHFKFSHEKSIPLQYFVVKPYHSCCGYANQLAILHLISTNLNNKCMKA